MAADYGKQRQRHGPTKNLVEGIGGFIAGAALVVLIGNLLKKGPPAKQQTEAVSVDAPKGKTETQA